MTDKNLDHLFPGYDEASLTLYNDQLDRACVKIQLRQGDMEAQAHIVRHPECYKVGISVADEDTDYEALFFEPQKFEDSQGEAIAYCLGVLVGRFTPLSR